MDGERPDCLALTGSVRSTARHDDFLPLTMKNNIDWKRLSEQQHCLLGVEGFARAHNINPWAWFVVVVFNGQSSTFLRRREHRVLLRSGKPESYDPITAFTVGKFQYLLKNLPHRMTQNAFALNYRLSVDALRRLVDTKGRLTPYGAGCWQRYRPDEKVFIAPSLLGCSASCYERITAEHLTAWESARRINDYGIMQYLSRYEAWRRFMNNQVDDWRERMRRADGVLDVRGFAHKHHITTERWQGIVEDIQSWDCQSALYRRYFAMIRFGVRYRLDPLVWNFLALSNELSFLGEEPSSQYQVQQAMHLLYVLQTEIVDRLSDRNQVMQVPPG